MTTDSEFFKVLPVEEALARLFAQWHHRVMPESLDVRQASGRTLAEAVYSPCALPAFRRSTMDGYAVRAADTHGASQSLPAMLRVTGRVVMGEPAEMPIERGQAVEIHTGGMLPPDADAVVMVEKTQTFGENMIEVMSPVAPGENVVDVGEDMLRGDMILRAGQRVRPQDIGGLLAVGELRVIVAARPRIGVLSCGDELVAPEETPQPGQIRDINAYMLAALIEQVGGVPVLLGIARDTLDDYRTRAQSGLEGCDMLVLTAGSSVSSRDLTRTVIENLGAPGILQHGLAVKPGKPTILALCDGKPVIGLPGNPVSALLVARQIVCPIIRRWLGVAAEAPARIQAILSANIASTTGRLDTIPVRLIQNGDQLLAEPVFGKSNLIYTLIHADGLMDVPLNSGGLKAGTLVEVERFV